MEAMGREEDDAALGEGAPLIGRRASAVRGRGVYSESGVISKRFWPSILFGAMTLGLVTVAIAIDVLLYYAGAQLRAEWGLDGDGDVP